MVLIQIEKDKRVLVLKEGDKSYTNLQFCHVCKREIISDFFLCPKYKRVFCCDCGKSFYCEDPRILPVYAHSDKTIKSLGLDVQHEHKHLDLIRKEWLK